MAELVALGEAEVRHREVGTPALFESACVGGCRYSGRVLPLSGELLELMKRAADRRRLDCPRVFHVNGQPIGDFRKPWKQACTTAGLSGLIVHDLRRSAVRNMVRAGIPERVCMALSGHKSRDVFERYNIVSESDLTAAADRLHAHLQQQPTGARVVPLKAARQAG